MRLLMRGVDESSMGWSRPTVRTTLRLSVQAFIDSDLAQLQVSYVDLLLLHHRCHDAATTQAVWGAMEEAKKSGKARSRA